MFLKTLKMELVRAFHPSKILFALGIILLLLLGSDWQFLENAIKNQFQGGYGSIDELYYLLNFDTFKCILVIALSGLYTNSFCKDDNSHYLRMILNRIDSTTYIQCRFLANILVILVTSIVAFYLYILVMYPLLPPLGENGPVHNYYYEEIVANYPLVYVGMTGVVFGLVAAASSSVGLLFSAYKPNSFVSIAISGLVFFCALSYIPYGNPFNVLNIVGMRSVLGSNVPQLLMYMWTHVYMLTVIGFCGLLFYRRMKWRVENGYL